MTQLSQARRSTLPRKPISPEELASRQQQRHDLAVANCKHPEIKLQTRRF
jgi:hypothetical protein